MRPLLLALMLVLPACTTPPPNLTPDALVAFRGTQIIHDLDRIRDVANEAHSTSPPLLNASVTLEIVEWHRTAIRLVHDHGANWQAAVMHGLDDLQAHLSAKDRHVIAPYLQAVRVLLSEAHR